MVVARILTFCGILLLSPVWGSNVNDTVRSPSQSGSSSSHLSRESSFSDQNLEIAVEKLLAGDSADGRRTISKTLGSRESYDRQVAKHYLARFNFTNTPLLESMRYFLFAFPLTGESQQIDRIMQHFSKRYHECNPNEYSNIDQIHQIVIAILLLNADLHNKQLVEKMTSQQFISNILDVQANLSVDHLKTLYKQVKKRPLKMNLADMRTPEPPKPSKKKNKMSPALKDYVEISKPGSILTLKLPISATVYKEGILSRKNEMKKTGQKVKVGHRNWKRYHVFLKGFLLYFQKPDTVLNVENTKNAIYILHAMAKEAVDYHKAKRFFRLTRIDGSTMLLAAAGPAEMKEWIDAINGAAAKYSSAPVESIDSEGLKHVDHPIMPSSRSVVKKAQIYHNSIKQLIGIMPVYHLHVKAKALPGKKIYEEFEIHKERLERYNLYFASLFRQTVQSMPISSDPFSNPQPPNVGILSASPSMYSLQSLHSLPSSTSQYDDFSDGSPGF